MIAVLAVLFALGIGGGVLITALRTRLGRQRCQDLRRPVSGGIMSDPVRAWVYSAIAFSIVPIAWLLVGTLILPRCF